MTAVAPGPGDGHDLSSVWEDLGGGSRREVGLSCARCGLYVEDPSYILDRDGETVCLSLRRAPACDEELVRRIMES